MAQGTVTASTVNALQTEKRDVFLWDDKLAGFGVKVTPAGNKVYVLQYRLGGRGSKTKRFTIGREGSPWRPASARKEAERLLALVRQGVDIAAKAKEAKHKATRLGFADYVKGPALDALKEHWPKSWGNANAALDNHAIPHLSKPLPDIGADDLRRVLSRLSKHPASRRYLYSVLSYVFSVALEAGDIDANPLARVKPPATPKARKHTLNDDELRWFWTATLDEGDTFGPFARLLLLTLQRRNEVAGLPWLEVDQKAREWELDAARSKNGEPNLIPIGTLAGAELDRVAGKAKWPRRGLVFTTTGKTPISGFSTLKRRLDASMAKMAKKEGAAVRPWTFHDLRRTGTTRLQGLGVAHDVREHLLNHKEVTRSGVASHYSHHEYKDEKREAIARWEGALQRIVAGEGAKVVKLRA